MVWDISVENCAYHGKKGLSWFNWWLSFAPDFSVAISVSPNVCFTLILILISMFLR